MPNLNNNDLFDQIEGENYMQTLNIPHYYITEKPFFLLSKSGSDYIINANGLGIPKGTHFKKPALININEEYGKPYDPAPMVEKFPEIPILKLAFSDVTAIVYGDEYGYGPGMGGAEQRDLHPISEEDCNKVFEFIERENPDLVIANCAAGVSRSSAVAYVLHYLFGAKLPDNFWKTSCPNCFCVGRMMIAFEKRKQEQEY